MELKILSFSWRNFHFSDVISVTLMTQIWEITILNNHSPLLTQLRPATIYFVYKDSNGHEKRDDFFVWNWVVEVSNSNVKILSDVILDIEDLWINSSERAKEDAITLMQKYRDDKNKIDMEKYIQAEELLVKSIWELKLSKV